MQPVDLPKIVTVAHAQGYCAGSRVSIGDSFPIEAGTEDVVGIGKLLDGATVVGWVYRTKSGKFFLQGNDLMSKQDQEVAGFTVPQSARHIRTVSPIVPLESVGSDLRISDCTPKEYGLSPQRKP